jgi:cyclopropane fatty-acyl-phospholipid synthase-like methyltransferase
MASIVDDRGYSQGFQWTPTQRVRMERRAQAILDEVQIGKNDRILELGCGTGELAHMIAAQTSGEVIGVDLCEPFVEQANRNFGSDRLHYVKADISTDEGMQTVGTGYAAVFGNGILHHVYYKMNESLRYIRRLLAPGGKLVFWEPNLFNPYVFAIFKIPPLRKVAKLEPDEMAFTPRWIEQRLSDAGFVDVHVDYRDFLLPVVPPSLIDLVTRAGDVVETIPGLNRLAQSLFVCASAR